MAKKPKSKKNQATLKTRLKGLSEHLIGMLILLFIAWAMLDQLGIIHLAQNMMRHIAPIVTSSGHENFLVPDRQHFVTDLAEVIDEEDEAKIVSIAQELKDKTSAEIAVLTVQSLNGHPLEESSIEVARSWQIGDKEKDNGLLIFVAAEDRKLRTEIGYGLEGTITDGTSGQIQDEAIIPYFKVGNMSQGVLSGVEAYARHIAKAHQVLLNQTPVKSDPLDDDLFDFIAAAISALVGLGLVIWFVLWIFFDKGGGGSGDDSCGGSGSSDDDRSSSSSSDSGGGDFGGGGSSRSW